MSVRVLLLCFLLSVQGVLHAEEQRITSITAISLDGQSVPQAQWSTLCLDSNSIVVFSFICREGISTSAGVRYVVELDNGDQRDQKTQYENTKTYVGLPSGHYALVVRAQSNDNAWAAVPTTLQFIVDPKSAADFRQHLAAASHGDAQSVWWRSPAVVIILCALLILAIVVSIVILMSRATLRSELRDLRQKLEKQPQPAPSSVVVKEKKVEDSPQFQQLLKEVERFKKENAKLNKRVLDLSRRTEELNDQNLDLALQVDRAAKVKSELEDLQQQKDDLFAMIIHDIKNPASLIKNLVDLLRGYDLNSSETQEVMQDIIETTTKIVSLSQELSRVMAMDHADIQLDFESTNAGVIIESVCRRNAVSAEKKGIDIRYEIPPNLPTCEFDPQKIEEVLDNLVSNAVKFSLPGTKVTVRALPTDDYLRLDVEDQGLGMSKEDTKLAFQRGMKLSARPTADEPSSGLGLWIVKRLVEAHHGRVSVKSEIGMGTTFSVFLPYKAGSSIAAGVNNEGSSI